ncbi:MAG: beta-ketoacyl-[acyl-carrier-protein] synthase family protein [Prevotellaceae bacterium]|jgi:3-oxoacyl-[acyl-carrier-protein] synthase II|nr:beta-ketoacyl-[acyl-carrier-protein] synthase family protein [Prevotellaceae bacterium]
MEKRIVITGLGAVSPIGCNPMKLYHNINENVTNFTLPEYLVNKYNELHFVSLVSNDWQIECDKRNISPDKTLTNYILLGVMEALEESGLLNNRKLLKKTCLYVGSSKNYLFNDHDFIDKQDVSVERNSYPLSMLRTVSNQLGIGGENLLLPVACSGGNVAISLAEKQIKSGVTDIVIAGGVDIFNETCYAIFSSLGILSKRTATPFMTQRDGITVGEGAGFVIMESLESAQARGANILAEVLGSTLSCDAFHLTTPNPEGTEAANAMKYAIDAAQLTPDAIDCISPHATGTKTNDLQEANAIKKVFGNYASDIPISAAKASLGHCMGAASALEAVLSVLSLEYNIIPKTFNKFNDVCEFDLNLCNYSANKEVNTILSNSFAFGGNISCVIFGKYRN